LVQGGPFDKEIKRRQGKRAEKFINYFDETFQVPFNFSFIDFFEQENNESKKKKFNDEEEDEYEDENKQK
jgi:hypothetical protein